MKIWGTAIDWWPGKRIDFLVVIPVILLIIGWLLSMGVLWWVYDITPLIQGGFYTHDRALRLVASMGVILISLTAVVWLFAANRNGNESPRKRAWAVCWKTALVLTGYAIIVVVRRMQWRPSQGLNDDAMFLPFIGRINAPFFSEVGWVAFILEVIPLIACISGLLYWLHVHVMKHLR